MDTFDLYLEKDSISLYLPDNGYESNHHSLSTTKTNILNLDHTISMYYHSFPIFLSISSNESHILYKKNCWYWKFISKVNWCPYIPNWKGTTSFDISFSYKCSLLTLLRFPSSMSKDKYSSSTRFTDWYTNSFPH